LYLNKNQQVDMKNVESIRDFFLATNSQELKRAYQNLDDDSQNEAPAVTDWQEVEFTFNRLFVGPAALQAPPFSSVYLDGESQVMGKTTMEVRQMYSALGLESPWKNSLPDDHISLELDAALAMNHIARQTEQMEMQELRERFMTHMDTWVPLFVERVQKAPSQHSAINYVVTCLTEWLRQESRRRKERI
jgi:TorA maturation chaperone TorD